MPKNISILTDDDRFPDSKSPKYNIDLLLENEPVCRISTKDEIEELFSNNSSPNLKLWLDVANLLRIDETIDDNFLKSVSIRIGYVHVKDFIIHENQLK